MQCERRAIAAALLLAQLAVAACSRKPIEVDDQEQGGDFGATQLNEAVVAAGHDRDSPEAFKALADRIERLRVLFNEPVSELAERKLVFLAVHPIAAFSKRTQAERMGALALTVWPIAIKVRPGAQETPRAYLLRVCNEELATTCQRVVPEHWPLVVGREVVNRLRARARDSFAICDQCKSDPSYQQVLELYDDERAHADAEYTEVRSEVSPNAWPIAGAHASPLPVPPPPLLAVRPGGEASYRGVKIENGDWGRAIKVGRSESEGLAVHLWPDDRVALMRSVLRSARNAGYSWVALQARELTYPYDIRMYRLGVSGKGNRVAVRDTDTIQVLVHFLDSATDRGAAPDARTALMLEEQ